MQITETLHIMHCSKSLYTNITPFSQLYKRILQIQQMIQKPLRFPITETGAVIYFIGAFSSAHAITCGDF